MSATETEREIAKPRYESMAAALEATDPGDYGMVPAVEGNEGSIPAESGAAPLPAEAEDGTTPAPQEGQPEQEVIDWEARYRELEAKQTSDAARELSAAGRLKKANEELARTQAERDDFKRRVEDQNVRIDKWWEEAIAAAPEEQKAEYRRLHALDQRERQLQQQQEAIALNEQQTERQREEVRAQATQAARFYATAELDSALEARAQHEGLPVELVKPVRDWLNSPYVKKIVNDLPLRKPTPPPPGDPADWDVLQIDDLDKYRTHLVAQAERGYQFYKQQHTQAQAKAEEERVAANAAAAQQTYQPERPVGAGVSAPQRDLSKYRNSNNIAAVLDIEDGMDPNPIR